MVIAFSRLAIGGWLGYKWYASFDLCAIYTSLIFKEMFVSNCLASVVFVEGEKLGHAPRI